MDFSNHMMKRYLLIIFTFMVVMIGVINFVPIQWNRHLNAEPNVFHLQFIDVSNKSVVNGHRFEFLIHNSHSCDQKVTYIIVVHSAIKNIRKRQIIRETWGKAGLNGTSPHIVRFFLGISTSHKENEEVIAESSKYGDIIVQNFIDSYKNLTYKSMSWLEWIGKNCPQAKHVVKVDDDMMVNIFKLDMFLLNLRTPDDIILCALRVNEPVLRSKKWKVEKKDFPKDTYPDYCPGPAVIFDASVIPKLNFASYYVPFFWIDDVYFTGLLRLFIRARIVDVGDIICNKSVKLLKSKFIFHLVQDDQERIDTWTFFESYHNSSNENADNS